MISHLRIFDIRARRTLNVLRVGIWTDPPFKKAFLKVLKVSRHKPQPLMLWAGQGRSGQAGQVRSGRSGQVRQVRSGLGQVRQVRSGQAGQVRFKSGQAGQVRSGRSSQGMVVSICRIIWRGWHSIRYLTHSMARVAFYSLFIAFYGAATKAAVPDDELARYLSHSMARVAFYSLFVAFYGAGGILFAI